MPLLVLVSGGPGTAGHTHPSEPTARPVLIEVRGAEPSPSPVSTTPAPDGPAAFAEGVPPEAVRLAFTGDVNLGGRVGGLIDAHGPAYPWEHVRERLRTADVAVVNLECTVSRRGAPLDKEFTFRADPEALVAMADAGVDVAGLGNNHAVDYGRTALADTLVHLREAGIAPVGAGMDDDEAYRPVVVERRGTRIAFVSATRVMPDRFAADPDRPGVASAYEEARLVEAVGRADAGADVVVVLIHWGQELQGEPDDTQVRLGRALVDAGADAVVGHHPHVLQPVARYRGAVIAYSLGNFVFSSPSAATRDTMLLEVGVLPGGELVVGQVPMRVVDTRPTPTGS